jgi:dihydrofolate reductase
MSKLIMFNLMSLDGYFEGATNWTLDWHQRALDENFFQFALDQLRTADALIFGRITYEGMARHWPTATGEIAASMNDLPKVVFSRTLERVDWKNTKLVKDDPVTRISELKRQGTRNLFVFGSAVLSRPLMDAGLFDEYRLGLTSVILGSGRPLFGQGVVHQVLNLVETKPLGTGCVVCRYEPSENN